MRRPGRAVGAGKSTLLRSLYGNYRVDAGRILVRHAGAMVDLASAPPRTILDLRASTIGYVSQFLRVVPRVPAETTTRCVVTLLSSPVCTSRNTTR